MLARVPAGIGIGVKLPQASHLKAGFFFGLPQRGCFIGFSVIDKTSGQGPAKGRILPLDQDYLVTDFDNNINGRQWVPMCFHFALGSVGISWDLSSGWADKRPDFLPIGNCLQVVAIPVPGLGEDKGGNRLSGQLDAGFSPIIDEIFETVLVDVADLVVMIAGGYHADIFPGGIR